MDDSPDPAPPDKGGQDAPAPPEKRLRPPRVIHVDVGPAPIVVVDAPAEVPLSRTQRARYLQLSRQMADELCPAGYAVAI
jgi:hypothetical protein